MIGKPLSSSRPGKVQDAGSIIELATCTMAAGPAFESRQ
jgi:hypothetical protein